MQILSDVKEGEENDVCEESDFTTKMVGEVFDELSSTVDDLDLYVIEADELQGRDDDAEVERQLKSMFK